MGTRISTARLKPCQTAPLGQAMTGPVGPELQYHWTFLVLLQVQAPWALSSLCPSRGPTDLGPWAWACPQGAGAWAGAWGAEGAGGTSGEIAGGAGASCKVGHTPASVVLGQQSWLVSWQLLHGSESVCTWRRLERLHTEVADTWPDCFTTQPQLGWVGQMIPCNFLICAGSCTLMGKLDCHP